MVELKECVSVPLQAAQVWALIKDPLTVASCINGATLEKANVSDMYTGTMRVKFGPTVVSFLGEAKVIYDDSTRSCTLHGRGRDKRGASNATAFINIAVSGSDSCDLNISGEFALTGPLEGFARTGGVHVARVLLKDFAEKLAQAAAPADSTLLRKPLRESAEVLNAAAVTRQVTLDGFLRLIHAIKKWINNLFRGKTI
jgi:carbon monoxide dehydrogenase subunit G